ncbi:MAG: MEDS domain-containing protein [Nitriliruptoraceae bacterium]
MNDVPHLESQRGSQPDAAHNEDPAHPDHLVTFYESSSFLARSARRFLLAGLDRGETIIVVATPAHRDAFAAALEEAGHDLARSRREGRYLERDAAATLAELVVDGRLCRARFDRVISRFVAEVAATSGGLRVFGEMVALLWEAGDLNLALELEDHWNTLIEQVPLPLLCAYPLSGFDSRETTARFHDVCGRHSRVTTDSYATLDDTGIAMDGVVLLGAREPGGLQG